MKTKEKKSIIVIGGGGHARVLINILQTQRFKILGYTDLEEKNGLAVPYLGNDADVRKNYKKEQVHLVNGVGSVKLPAQRKKVYEDYKKLGYVFLSVIHPRAIISRGVTLKEGVQINAGAVINTGTVVEEDVIVNTLASVDHDCIIGAHTHIAPGVTVSGGVRIGQCCHIAIGAKIIQGIHIGDNVFVPAGAVVVENAGDNTKAEGLYQRKSLGQRTSDSI